MKTRTFRHIRRVAALTLLAAASAGATTVSDRIAVISVVDDIGLAADLREWEVVRAQLAETVRADYSSLTGSPAADVKADDLVASWKAFLPGFTSTQHAITNHRVVITGRQARVTSTFIATHRLVGAAGGELWTLGGRYLHTLTKTSAGWKVTAMTMTWTWQTGNTDLPKLAAAAAAQTN